MRLHSDQIAGKKERFLYSGASLEPNAKFLQPRPRRGPAGQGDGKNPLKSFLDHQRHLDPGLSSLSRPLEERTCCQQW